MDKNVYILKIPAPLEQDGIKINVFPSMIARSDIMVKEIIANLSLKNVYHQQPGTIMAVKLQEVTVLLELMLKEENVLLIPHAKMGSNGIITC